jgi:hypothetical protein
MDTNQPNQTEPSDPQETASQSGSPDNPEVLSPEELQLTASRSVPDRRLSDETPSPIVLMQVAILSALERIPVDKLPDLFTVALNQLDEREKQALSNSYDLQKQAQSNNYRITLYSIGAIVLIILSSLAYAAYTEDNSLLDKLSTSLLGTAGGAGIFAFLNRPKS